MNDNQTALQRQLDAALAAVGKSADASRALIDGDVEALNELGQGLRRPPLLADVPVDVPPPYVPSPVVPLAHALIPDTPLVDAPAAAAFDDDAPLWQG